MITKNVTLYLGDVTFPAHVRVSQFDTMWRFIFDIVENSQPWEIPSGATAVLNGRKPDNNVFAFAGTVANNTITVDCDVQMTACAGATVCELSIVADGKVVGTANFYLDVEAAPKSPDDVSSESTLPAYEALLIAAANIPSNIPQYITDWLTEHITQPTNLALDDSLTVSGAAADAKTTGDAITDVVEQINLTRNAFGDNSKSYRNTISTTAGTTIAANKKVLEVHISAGQVYVIKIVDNGGAIQGNSIALYRWDENGTRVSIANNKAVNTSYAFRAGFDISAFSMYVTGSKVSTGSVEFQVLVQDVTTNQIDVDDVVRGSYDSTSGRADSINGYCRLEKPLVCSAGCTIECSTAFKAFEYDVLSREFIAASASWANKYQVQHNALVLIAWQTDIANAQTAVNATLITPAQPVISDAALPVNSIEAIARRVNKNYHQSGTVLSIAHRGNYYWARGMMCGASAVIAAKRAGYTIVENDVALTSDGKMVMWHDTTLARIGDSSHGVSDYTLAELKEMDFGSAFGSQFAGEQILTFAEWILLCKKVGVSCYIDFKVTGSSFTDALAQEVVATIKRYGMLDNVTYLANFGEIRTYHTNARLATLQNPTEALIQSCLPYLAGGRFAFNPKSSLLTAESAALALDNGFELECWCVDYASNGLTTKNAVFDEIERVVELGVQRITLDAYRVEDVFDERYGLL